ncbi:MAG: hypothetical protein MUO50_18050 [Longimicrobiales bacterium]|nr:hypothetical protein [Longimicrobiales bacterium]
MARTSHSVLRALRRWEEKGLLDRDLAGALREEVEEDVQGESRRWSQYLLAGTGGAVLLVAGGTFLAWAWPEMGYAGRSVTLGVLGFLVLGLGMWLPTKGKWVPVAYLLQVSGSVLILMALIHSEKAWSDGTVGGWCVGLLGLLLPVPLLWRAVREHGVLAGLQAALSFLFLFVFLDRSLGLSEDAILWVLDGVMLVALGVLAFRLRDPGVPRWVLSVFLALLFSTLVLILFSATILWDLDADTMYPLDLWLLTVAGLCLWGLLGGAPVHLRRDWYEHQLALCILLGIVFGFSTTLETLGTGPTPAAFTVATVGALGLWYSLPRGAKSVLVASCLALLISAWYWGAEMSGALGAVLALVVVSAVLFWGATRMGRWAAAPEAKGAEQDGG